MKSKTFYNSHSAFEIFETSSLLIWNKKCNKFPYMQPSSYKLQRCACLCPVNINCLNKQTINITYYFAVNFINTR